MASNKMMNVLISVSVAGMIIGLLMVLVAFLASVRDELLAACQGDDEQTSTRLMDECDRCRTAEAANWEDAQQRRIDQLEQCEKQLLECRGEEETLREFCKRAASEVSTEKMPKHRMGLEIKLLEGVWVECYEHCGGGTGRELKRGESCVARDGGTLTVVGGTEYLWRVRYASPEPSEDAGMLCPDGLVAMVSSEDLHGVVMGEE